ncbi:hypothetical protein [Clostridium sp.]|uniref:hypothetical protein n=1 Tax=Clostridium sp. TaxID=1506 RepID=UPI0032166CA7
MKKYKFLTLLLFIVISLTFIGCSKKAVTLIDWIDFLKWNNISYENTNTIIPKEYIGNEIGEVSKIAPSEVTGTKTPKTENGDMPFKDLKATEVEKISLYVCLPGKTIEIEDREEINQVVDILNKVVTYEEAPSNTQYCEQLCGQLVQYTLTLESGATLKIGAYNPFILINDVTYKTKYAPCEELNALGNRLINNK